MLVLIPTVFAAIDDCLTPAGIAAVEGFPGDFAASLDTARFRVAWDPADPGADEAAALAGVALEEAWAVEFDELGWPEPAGWEEGLLPVLVGQLPDDRPNAGLTGRALCGEEVVTYLAFNTDLFHGQALIEDVTSHELAHLSQYGIDGYSASPTSAWYFEATAVWMEDQVHPENNTYIHDFVSFFLTAPGAELDAFGWPPLTEYGHAVFLHYLDQHVGGNELLLASWTDAAPTDDALAVLDGLLRAEDGRGLAEHFGQFLAHMAAFDFADGAAWEAQDAANVAAGLPSLYASAAEGLPAADTLEEEGTLPQALGCGFARLDLEPPGAGHGVRIRFFGATGEGGEDPGWKVGIAATGASGVELRSADAPGGRLVIDLDDPTLTSVRIGVGPTTAAGEGLAWSWDAALIDVETDTGGEDTSGAADTADDADDAEPAKGSPGCGCDARPGGSASPWFAALAPLLLRLRKGGKRIR